MAGKRKQIIVFGMGRFGEALARTLCEQGCEVLAVDESEERVREIAPFVTHAVQMDATDEEALKSLGVRNFDAAVVAIGQNIRDSILVSLLCKETGVPFVMSKANDELHAKVLRKMGVDRVVFPERDMGVRAARTLLTPNVLDLINLSDDYTLADISTPDAWADKTLLQADVRRRYAVSVLAIHRGDEVIMTLTGDTVMRAGDALLILGRKDDVEKVEELH